MSFAAASQHIPCHLASYVFSHRWLAISLLCVAGRLHHWFVAAVMPAQHTCLQEALTMPSPSSTAKGMSAASSCTYMPQLDCVVDLAASCCPGVDWPQNALSTPKTSISLQKHTFCTGNLKLWICGCPYLSQLALSNKLDLFCLCQLCCHIVMLPGHP